MTRYVGLAYCSKPTNFSFEQSEEILRVSQRNNERDALTGALIYDNNTYLQWLEGGANEIRAAFARISRDPRHGKIKLLAVQELDDRWFPDWSMTAAVTQDQTLRGLKLVPHLSLSQFNPFDWSEEDVTYFMDALSDYLTKRPAPKSEPLKDDSVSPRVVGGNPLASLDRRLHRIL
ncbi:Sensors of blue-light using FAD [Salinihabitans flavidus]|uniref:Sensors of blue-light using FAD n=1 Tax=Salinihabitans flavidus TaxID=569882 RepID=A0A1H8W2X9_9RHOB|nr:BLUF domain-containing protein [Salinihabitans flavidus]SEP21985.1 Sensors of blue-light using FAD [Salinihabitans flavidus]